MLRAGAGRQRIRLASRICGELDLAHTIAGVRVRINLFRQKGSVSAALRLLSDVIPPLDELGLSPAVLDFPRLQRGIILVTGETGSGKSTTMAALLDQINHTRTDHIITLEDPVEYVHTPDQCVINQREIGTDTASYADALRAVLREDPDVILIGEMRDLNTIETALTAAETGHLVLATLHTNSAADSIDRMVDVFPEGLAAPDSHAGVHVPSCRAEPAAGAQARRRARAGGGTHDRDACHPQPHPRGQDAPDSQRAGHVGIGGVHHHGQRADQPVQAQFYRCSNRH